jgi:hypothetical protein
MKASILFRYLTGSRGAIVEVASTRSSLSCGILFALSAGLAREYDGEDLLHAPWIVLRPLAASLLSGTVLFLLVHLASTIGKGKRERPGILTAYRALMSLFWMTAPMAWLYAIPYERFLSEVDAIVANLWTLALVSLWRVLLMTRAIGLLYGIEFAASLVLVLLFSDAVIITLLTLVEAPVIGLMGGIRHSDADALIAHLPFSATFFSVISAPVLLIAGIVAFLFMKPAPLKLATIQGKPSRGLLLLAAGSILAFTPPLLIGQPEQANRRVAEDLLRSGNVAGAFALMSERTPDDYPPHWEAPPRLGYREKQPDLAAVRDAMRARWPAEWVARLYLDKVHRRLREKLLLDWRDSRWIEFTEKLEKSGRPAKPDGDIAEEASFLLDFDTTLPDGDRQVLRLIVALGQNGG